MRDHIIFMLLSIAPLHSISGLNCSEELSALCCYREDCLLSACMCARMREREISSGAAVVGLFFAWCVGRWGGIRQTLPGTGRSCHRSATFKSRPTRAHAIGTFHHQPQLFRNTNLYLQYIMICLGILIKSEDHRHNIRFSSSIFYEYGE